jgi:hypothetical protein
MGRLGSMLRLWMIQKNHFEEAWTFLHEILMKIYTKDVLHM